MTRYRVLQVIIPIVALVALVSACEERPFAADGMEDLPLIYEDPEEGWRLFGDGSTCVAISVPNENLNRIDYKGQCEREGLSLIADAYLSAGDAYVFGFTPFGNSEFEVSPGSFQVQVFQAPSGQHGTYFVALGRSDEPEVRITATTGGDVGAEATILLPP